MFIMPASMKDGKDSSSPEAKNHPDEHDSEASIGPHLEL